MPLHSVMTAKPPNKSLDLKRIEDRAGDHWGGVDGPPLRLTSSAEQRTNRPCVNDPRRTRDRDASQSASGGGTDLPVPTANPIDWLLPANRAIFSVMRTPPGKTAGRYHRAKFAFLKDGTLDDKRATSAASTARFAPVADFLESIPTTCPHDLFRRDDGARSS
jgi:hypothetical protein